MNAKRIKPGNAVKRYSVEFSLTSIFFWGLGLLFLLVWIFVLGILVGRGFLLDGVKSLADLKSHFGRFQDRDSVFIGEKDKAPEFEFHYKLATKKKEAITEKSRTKVKKRIDNIQETKPTKSSHGGIVYTVQLASLESKNRAVELVNRLNNRGYQAYFYHVSIGGKTYYRVRCGKFETKKQASDLQTLLAQNERLDGFVTTVGD